MTCSRREWLRLTALTVTTAGLDRHLLWAQTPAAAPAPAGAAQAAPAPPPVKPVFTDVRRNVGIFTARGGTIAYLINPGGIVIVDTQFPDTAKLCVEGLKTRAANRPFDYVVNTHHHGDHTGGNAVFRESAKQLVAHDNVPELMKAAAARAAQTNPSAPAQTPTLPDTTFAETASDTLGDETVSGRYYGPAHTSGDIVVLFQQANVAHMGDLLFNRLHPFIDRTAGASIAGWITLLERVMKDHPSDTRYVFGHAGPKFEVTGTRADLALQRDYFLALMEFTRSKVKSGVTRDAFVKITETLPKFPDHGPLLERTLGAAFDEVSASA